MRKIWFIVFVSFLVGCTTSQVHIAPTVIPSPTASSTPAAIFIVTPGTTPVIVETLDAFEARAQFLFNEPASNIIQFFLEIREAVSSDNKEKLASLVHYPIGIYLPTNNRSDSQKTIIHDQNEFIANYEKIATPEWKNIIRAQDPLGLFMNWQGIMVHRGELWFSGVCLDQKCQQVKYYIIAINNVFP
jgi:hypothetical protein